MNNEQVKEIDDKLIKHITNKMEEYGMPKFDDNLPALNILGIIKDAGYTRHAPNVSNEKLVALDEGAVEILIHDKLQDLMIPTGITFDEYNKISNKLSKIICKRFGQPSQQCECKKCST